MSKPAANRRYNLAEELIGRNLESRPSKVAFIDGSGSYTYTYVAQRTARSANWLRGLGLEPGNRVVLCLADGIDFVTAFLGCVLAGIVPVTINPLFKAEDYAYILQDCDAKAAIVTVSAIDQMRAAIHLLEWRGQLIQGDGKSPGESFSALIAGSSTQVTPFDSTADDVAFWLYSSGSTGRPKGTPHRHGSPLLTAELFAQNVFGLQEGDRVFSAAKLFFAYGLGNGLTFPMSVGATTVFLAERATPDVVWDILVNERITVFCGVPTLYAAMLADPKAPSRDILSLRRCLSAGEGLPRRICEAWTDKTGAEIIDGIGSTEMLHIYVSNRPGAVAYGTAGVAVPGYEVKLLDETGAEPPVGELGELYVRGPTMTPGYWRLPAKNAETFSDGWMKTGDKFLRDAAGNLVHCGRGDDMLKVSGIWVSPAEVEQALASHPAVLEAAVVGAADANNLTKPKAYIVLNPGFTESADLVREIQAFAKKCLAPYKYPRWVEFVSELPKTSTGKIQRYVLRESQQPGAEENP